MVKVKPTPIVASFSAVRRGRPPGIHEGSRWADRNKPTDIITVQNFEASTGIVSYINEAGKQFVMQRDIFHPRYIRLAETKKPGEKKIKTKGFSALTPPITFVGLKPKKKKLGKLPTTAIETEEENPTVIRTGNGRKTVFLPPEEAATKAVIVQAENTKKAPKKFTPKDKTPFLVELQQEVIPRLQRFEFDLQEIARQAYNPVRVLSFDPGISNIAICFIDRENGQHLTSKIAIPEELTSTSVRLRYLEHVIEQWVRFFRPDVIFKEGVAHMAHNGVSDAGKLQYAIERIAMDYQISYMTIPTMRMRSFVGAAGKEHNKSDVKLQVFKKFNAEFNSEDECEAFAIAQTGIALVEKTWNPEAKPTKKSKEGKKK